MAKKIVKAPGRKMQISKLKAPKKAKVGAPFRVGPLVFSPRGAGSTPNHLAIAYRGFVTLMTPRQFLGLNEPLTHPRGRTKGFLRVPRVMAPPQLYIRENDDLRGGRVLSHEGRHRMTRLVEAGHGDTPVQVYVYPEAHRGRHFESVKSVLLDPRKGVAGQPALVLIHRRKR